MISDEFGNTLLGFHPTMPADVPAALVVVRFEGRVLMILDSWRNQWELPGGRLDPGETPVEAASRELFEETGISGVPLTFATVADFTLTHPDRDESLAVYRTELVTRPSLVVNAEALDFLWWSPATPVPPDMSPLDAAIAMHVLR